jgi:tetratricopeptide (TPR) repeat protein
MKKIPKILAYSSILILTIYLFISIAREYSAHKYLSDYKLTLKHKSKDAEYQNYLLKKSLRYSSSNAETLFELGKLNPIGKSKDRRFGSNEYFLEALKRKPTDARNRAVFAWYTGNKTNRAIENFNMAINLHPTDVYTHKLYAMWCMNQVRKEIDITNTVELLQQYNEWQGNDDPIRVYDGRYVKGLSISDLLRTTRTEWDKVQSLISWRRWYQDRAVHKNLADLNLLSFDIGMAIEHYKRTDNRLMLARCYIIKDDTGKAVSILGSVIKEGGTLFKRNLPDIKKLLTLSISSDPKNHQTFYYLGNVHARLNKNSMALSNFKTTVLLNPKHIGAHMNLAELYSQADKADLAIKEYETILEHSPNHKEATNLLSEAIMVKYKDYE